jgi:hypothetical protein
MEANMGLGFCVFSTYLVDKGKLVPSKSQLLCSFARGREKEKQKELMTF